MTGCSREWFENLSAYRDGEANADDVARIEAHVETCARCRDALDRLYTLGEALARLHPIEVPPRVVQRARAIVTSARGRRRLPRVLGFAVALAAAVVGLLFSLRHRGLEPAMADDLVAHHVRGFAREKPCDFETSDPTAASAWLSSQLGYSVRVPTPEGTRLLGVRLCKLEGVRTAALMYTHVETPLTIFVPPPGSGPAAHVAAFAGREVRCADGALHTRICAVGADQTMVAVEDGADARLLASTLAPR